MVEEPGPLRSGCDLVTPAIARKKLATMAERLNSNFFQILIGQIAQ
jgi:hypothetical protein